MFRRNRNLVLLGALAVIPIGLGIAVKVGTGQHGQGDGGFLDQVSNNGLFLVFAALSLTLPVFLPMALGVVSGDSISGEAAQGTLRYLLVAPVGRVRLLAVKGFALAVFCLVSTAVVSIAALLTGLALFPGRPGDAAVRRLDRDGRGAGQGGVGDAAGGGLAARPGRARPVRLHAHRHADRGDGGGRRA
jgi:ABC-2 type transport system permease protein